MVDIYGYSVEKVARHLGVEETFEILEYVLPRITQRQKELEEYFLAEDWDAAAKCAHQTISSVRQYGSERLAILLRQVKQADDGAIDTAALQQELSAEFNRVIQSVKEWLAAHSST